MRGGRGGTSPVGEGAGGVTAPAVVFDPNPVLSPAPNHAPTSAPAPAPTPNINVAPTATIAEAPTPPSPSACQCCTPDYSHQTAHGLVH